MNSPMKKRLFVCIIVGFSVSFFVIFFLISFTQSAYSTPTKTNSVFNQMSILLGPPPNSTNVPLDTTISIDTVASASLNDLNIIPYVAIDYTTSYVTGPLTYETNFYPTELLKPGISYNVSVTILDDLVTWTFTTTSQPFVVGINFYLAKNALLITFLVAAILTSILGFIIWFREKQLVGHST